MKKAENGLKNDTFSVIVFDRIGYSSRRKRRRTAVFGPAEGKRAIPIGFTKKGLALRAALCLVLGALLSLLTRGGKSGMVFLSDLLFAQASVLLAAGLIAQLRNMRMFASAAWGMKLFKRLFRGEKKKAGVSDAEDYFEYRNSRPRSSYAAALLLLALLFFVLSLVACTMPQA